MRLSEALAIIFCWIFFCLAVGLYYQTEIVVTYDTTITNTTIRLEAPTKWYQVGLSVGQDDVRLGIREVGGDGSNDYAFHSLLRYDGAEGYIQFGLGINGEIDPDSNVYFDEITYDEGEAECSEELVPCLD
jgi:hypothetical protein